jgi:hypothetical protein
MTRNDILNLAWVLVLVVAVILMVANPERFVPIAATLGIVVVGPIAGAGFIYAVVRSINRCSTPHSANRPPGAP